MSIDSQPIKFEILGMYEEIINLNYKISFVKEKMPLKFKDVEEYQKLWGNFLKSEFIETFHYLYRNISKDCIYESSFVQFRRSEAVNLTYLSLRVNKLNIE